MSMGCACLCVQIRPQYSKMTDSTARDYTYWIKKSYMYPVFTIFVCLRVFQDCQTKQQKKADKLWNIKTINRQTRVFVFVFCFLLNARAKHTILNKHEERTITPQEFHRLERGAVVHSTDTPVYQIVTAIQVTTQSV